jgi:hypothetical protein
MVGAIIDSMGAAQSMPFYAAIRQRKEHAAEECPQHSRSHPEK